MNPESHIEEAEQAVARGWRTLALRGVLAVAFGIVIVAWPNIGLTTLLALVAAFALVAGATALYGAFTVPVEGGRRAWLAVDGVLAIAFGIVVLVWPDLSARALLFAIAAWAVATGLIEFALGAFALPVTGGRALLLMLWGVGSVAFGVIMFAQPGAGALALLALVSAYAIVTGVLQIGFALELRRAAGELKTRLQPRASTKPALPN